MKTILLAIGKTDEVYLNEGITKYTNRIIRYTPYEMKIIPDIKNSKNMSQEQQKRLEGQDILSELMSSDIVVLLDEGGKQYTSRSFAEFYTRIAVSGAKRLVFVIGGPYGFSQEVYSRANYKISLSPMTFSHQMVRLIFAEQLYRAHTIIKGEPYHHD
jgi:23S rRNA (pseudouridine1915-N3)-methyltransferase